MISGEANQENERLLKFLLLCFDDVMNRTTLLYSSFGVGRSDHFVIKGMDPLGGREVDGVLLSGVVHFEVGKIILFACFYLAAFGPEFKPEMIPIMSSLCF